MFNQGKLQRSGSAGWEGGRAATGAGLVVVLAMATGCGMSSSQLLGIIDVSPHVGTATHGTSQNTVQFTATGMYGDPFGYGSCCLVTNVVNDARWTTSDPVNLTITKNGLAKCVGATVTPATITASASDDYGKFSKSAQLICK